MNAVAYRLDPCVNVVADPAGRTVAIGVDVGTDDRNAEDAVFEQAQIALMAVERHPVRGAQQQYRDSGPPTPRDTLELGTRGDIRPVVA